MLATIQIVGKYLEKGHIKGLKKKIPKRRYKAAEADRVGYKIKLYSRPLDYIGSIHVASGSPIIRQLVANL